MRKTPALVGKHIPFVEAAHRGGRQRPSAVLLRTSWTTGDHGAANGIAQAWHNPNNRVDSCHYVIDEAVVLRCVPDKVEAFSTKGNHKGTISINLCHNPPYPPVPSIIKQAAQLTARLCKLYSIPIRILSDIEEERWMSHKWRFRGGILLKTVGDFPTEKFCIYVEDAYEDL